jgi:hypothetical protein
LQRGFAIPLLVAFQYYLDREKNYIASGIMVISALIYVPIVVLMAATYGLTVIRFTENIPAKINLRR